MMLLMSVVLASVDTVKQRAKIANTKSNVKQVQNAFEMYFNDRADYPPFNEDFNNIYPGNPPKSTWLTIVDEITPYLTGRLEKDQWGNYFAYVKNYKRGCPNAWSVVCSAGPNGLVETNICQQDSVVGGDDVCVFFSDTD